MKTRMGFVSNSSSSSFILSKSNLTKKQLEQIRKHKDVVRTNSFKLLRKVKEIKKDWDDLDPGDSWNIEEDKDYIFGDTSIDNFNMYKYLQLIGIDIQDVSFYEYETCKSIVKHHTKRINNEKTIRLC